MTDKADTRWLAAVVITDVVGFSRLIEADETGTLAALKSLRKELWYPRIADHGRRVVKTTGDGQLVKFASAVSAVECAVDVQRTMARRAADLPEDQRIVLSLGINLEDVIADGDDI